MSKISLERRLENIAWIQKHRVRFCPRCGCYGRVYGEHYCEHCRDDYDKENIEAFDRAAGGKTFIIFDSLDGVHKNGGN